MVTQNSLYIQIQAVPEPSIYIVSSPVISVPVSAKFLNFKRFVLLCILFSFQLTIEVLSSPMMRVVPTFVQPISVDIQETIVVEQQRRPIVSLPAPTVIISTIFSPVRKSFKSSSYLFYYHLYYYFRWAYRYNLLHQLYLLEHHR